MVMRNTPVSDVLRRRMFMTGPQFDRNDPVGIMGSSPELMQAVMRNQPQLAPMATDFTGEPIMYPAGQNYGRRGDRTGEVTPIEITAPGAGTSAKRRRGGNRNNRQQGVTPENTTPEDTRPDVVGNVPQFRPETESQLDDAYTPVPRGAGSAGKSKEAEKGTDRLSLTERLIAKMGNKSLEEFIKDNRDILEEYAPIPENKNLKKTYLTKFFLDMAARGAQGDAPIAAAATAAPGTFDEFLAADTKQKERQADRDLLAVSMGVTAKTAQDAADRAINLKLLEIAADEPEKMKQIKSLMKDFGLSMEDALKRVYPESQGTATKFVFDKMREIGHSEQVAAQLAANEDAFKESLENKNYFLQLFRQSFLTDADINYMLQFALGPATEEEIIGALLAGGHNPQNYQILFPPTDPS